MVVAVAVVCFSTVEPVYLRVSAGGGAVDGGSRISAHLLPVGVERRHEEIQPVKTDHWFHLGEAAWFMNDEKPSLICSLH